jgi:hypothetical protein
MNQYEIVADRYPLPNIEKWVTASDEKAAYQTFWQSLTPEQQDSVCTLDVVDVKSVEAQ